jgi:23S rRNA (guanosine2251-2'-O)-methyltransferase
MTVSGFHAIEAVLQRRAKGCTLLLAREGGRTRVLEDLALRNGALVRRVNMAELDRLRPRDDHRGMLLVDVTGPAGRPSLREAVGRAGTTALVLVLDGVTDPHNLGAILRSADLFGVDFVVARKRRAAPITPAVLASSAGAAEWVPMVIVPNLAQALRDLRHERFWIYGADSGGASASDLDLGGRVAIVLGAEGGGLQDLVRKSCDALIGVPTRGHIDSLNVSVAAGVLMYEARRQQAWPGSISP